MPVDPARPAESWREAKLEQQESKPELQIRIAGDDEECREFSVGVVVNDECVARHQIVQDKGAWLPEAASQARFERKEDASAPLSPSARLRRRAGIDRHLPRVGEVVREALEIGDSLHSDRHWRKWIVDRWNVSAPRSRRGGKRELDPGEITRRMASDSLPRVAAELGGYYPQSLSNALHRTRRRQLGRSRGG